MNEAVISTYLNEDGQLEIYYGAELISTISDVVEGQRNKLIEDVLWHMGYVWNDDGTVSEREE